MFRLFFSACTCLLLLRPSFLLACVFCFFLHLIEHGLLCPSIFLFFLLLLFFFFFSHLLEPCARSKLLPTTSKQKMREREEEHEIQRKRNYMTKSNTHNKTSELAHHHKNTEQQTHKRSQHKTKDQVRTPNTVHRGAKQVGGVPRRACNYTRSCKR